MFDNTTPADQTGSQPVVTFKVGDREYDPTTAATKIEHADKHISTLEAELQALREKQALTEAQLRAREALSQNTPTQQPAPTSQAQVVNVDDILAQAEERVYASLTRKQQEATAAANLAQATAVAQEVFGPTYQQELIKRGEELGMDKEDIQKFASTKPEAFKRLFGLTSQAPKGNVAPVSSFSTRQGLPETPIQVAARALRDPKASGRERTAAIAAALAQAKQ